MGEALVARARCGGDSSSDGTRVLASGLGGGLERAPGGWGSVERTGRRRSRTPATRSTFQAAALLFVSSCAMPFSIARIWFTKSSRIAPFCIESGNGTEILSVAVAS
jgi:hypothetical protein